MTNTLFFMHITKTAGGSIKEIIRKCDKRIAFHYRDDPDFRKDFSYAHDLEILYGHFNFGVHEILGKVPRYAVFVREPIARCVSHFHQIRARELGHLGEVARQYNSATDYILGSCHWEFDNLMCRMISGVSNKIPFGDVDIKTYQYALENLRYFQYIGVVEKLNASVHRLSTLGIDVPTKIPWINRGSYEHEDENEVLEQFNKWDKQLYKYASERDEGIRYRLNRKIKNYFSSQNI